MLLAFAALASWAEFSPVATLAETRPAALAFAAAAAVLLAVLLRRAGGGRRVLVAGLALSGIAGAVAAKLLWLTYDESELAFASDGISLHGSLFAPRGDGPHPALVFLHGSGEESRGEFLYLAKLFARHGIAAFAYDKRGAGESGGSSWETDYEGYARDAGAAIEAVAARSEIDPGKIGILGHSEGGWVAPLVVARRPQTAFVIATSTTHLTPAEQVIYEAGAQVEAAGFGEAAARARELMRGALAFDRGGAAALDTAALDAELAAASREPWFAVAELPAQLDPDLDVTWWRSVMDFDPLPHWRRVRAPVLLISGGRDLKSDARASQAAIREALAAGGNRDVVAEIFPAMEHGTIEWWLPGRLPPPRFPKGYSRLLVEWTRQRLASD